MLEHPEPYFSLLCFTSQIALITDAGASSGDVQTR